MTIDRHLAHAFAEQLLSELRNVHRDARALARALANYTGSIDAAKAETRLILAIEDITDLSAQLAPASPEKEPAESADTAVLRTAAAAFANFQPPEA